MRNMNRRPRGARRSHLRGLLVLVSALALLTPLAVANDVVSPQRAAAVSGSDFDPGMIISDSLFYDNSAMTAAQIQTFLDGKIGSCLTDRCLNVAVLPVTSRPASYSIDTGGLVCSAIAGGNLRVSELIYRTQVACNISAKVILVTLQKEQGLVTSRAPSDWALRAAMGMGCPDTAPCDDAFAGLATQIMSGARQLRVYKVGGFGRQPGGQYVQYHPNAGCGGTTVNVRNYATAALYNYTPYQPNAAALANLGGTGDGCSSYGNRNFWRFYNDWFGSPTGPLRSYTNETPYVIARTAAGDLMIYPATGKGGWVLPTVIGSGWGTMRLLAVGGDFTGDRLRDIVAVSDAGDLYLYRTDGYLAITGSKLVGGHWGDKKLLAAPGDVNGDGRQDLVTIDTSGVMRIHPGDGAGGFGEPRTVGSGWESTTTLVAPGDFNGDGRADVMSVDSTGALRLHAGDGAGGFGSGETIGTGWEGMTSVLGIRDFDGDGRVDVLGIHADGGLWSYSGNGSGGWKASRKAGSGWEGMTAVAAAGSAGNYVAPRTPKQVGFGDLNGDRVRDIAALSSSGTLYAYRGNGTGSIGSPFVLARDWSRTRFIAAVGDYNGDGSPDVVSVDDGGTMWLHKRSYEKGFTDPVSYNSGWNVMSHVFAPGDMDEDGIEDLFAVDLDGVLWFYPGPDLRRKQAGTGWDSLLDIVGPGDFDGDGHADVLGRTTAGSLLLYRGNGNGGWKGTTTAGVGWQIYESLWAPGDFDGDGKPDLLARKTNGDLWLYTSDGKGGWKNWRQVGSGWDSMQFIG